MDLTSEEIDKCLRKFHSNFNNPNNNVLKNDKEIWNLVDLLTEELKISRENETEIQMNLNRLLQIDSVDITTKYIFLKETNEKLQEENIKLKNDLDNMEIQIIAEKEAVKVNLTTKYEEMEGKYQNEIKTLTEQTQVNESNYNKKVRDLYNEIQLTQATAAMQRDNLETELQRKLVDINNKLRESQNKCMALQLQVQNFKKQNHPPKVQNDKLNFHDNSVKKSAYEVISSSAANIPSRGNIEEDTNIAEIVEKTINRVEKNSSKYQPLDICLGDDFFPESSPAVLTKNVPAPTLYKTGTTTILRKNYLPPLKQCTEIVNKNKGQRKRKLYNPDDALEYLERLEHDE